MIGPYLSGALKTDWEFVLAPPAQLNEWLGNGVLQISLVSSFYYLQHRSELDLVEGYGIGSEGKVLSVQLLYPEELTSFAGIKITLDPESGTSNRILRWLVPEAEFVEQGGVAFLLIGDKCLTFDKPGYKRYDIGEEWFKKTKLPLPFGVIAARKGQKVSHLKTELERALQWSDQHRKKLAKQQNALSEERVLSYWDHLSYRFDYRYHLSLDYIYENVQ